jgi:hypothetical protein
MALRIIVRTDNAIHSVHLGTPVVTTFRTFEIDAPEVEQFLNQGGSNEDGTFLLRQIVGVEEVRRSPQVTIGASND